MQDMTQNVQKTCVSLFDFYLTSKIGIYACSAQQCAAEQRISTTHLPTKGDAQ